MAKSKSAKRHKLSQRNLDILLFLWKFKVATTAMLHEKFFSELSAGAAYYALQRLKRHSYLAPRTNEYGKNPLWTLERAGFEVVKAYLPELRADGFKSENKEHDLLCSAIQLGEFLKEAPENVELISEQMLRTYHKEFLPGWIPDVSDHMPDGYWCFKDGDKIRYTSLEVEINRKAKARYENYSFFYKNFPENSKVFWIVKEPSQVKNILFSMYEAKPKYKIHNFVLLKDVEKKGWQSTIVAGVDKNEIFRNILLQDSVHMAYKSHISCFQKYMLDQRLTYRIHSETTKNKNSKLSDCMEVSV